MTILIPSSKLLRATAGQPDARKFSLSSGEWFTLQNNVQSVLALPSDIAEFETRYGDASSGHQMKECFDAMRKLRQVANKYGNPKSLRQSIIEDPGILAKTYMPEGDAYLSTIWTIQQAHSDAALLSSTLRAIPTAAQGQSTTEVVYGIKSTFQQADQILDRMNNTVKNFDKLIKKFEELQGELEESQLAMRTYSDRSSDTRKELDKEIGELTSKIEKLENDRDEAYRLWLDLTISAVAAAAAIAVVGVAVSIVLAPATAGTSAVVGSMIAAGSAAAVGSALGIAAGVARSSYEDLKADVVKQTEFKIKRVAYRHDLGALDKQMAFSLPASTGLIDQLKMIRDGWNSSIGDINGQLSALDERNLADGPWLKQDQMDMSAANWTDVDTALTDFTASGFIDYRLVALGDDLPADDPEFKEALTA